MFWRFVLLLLTTTISLQGLVLEDLIETGKLKTILKGKKVGYYTGSFDPIHVGHESFAREVVDSGLCDYVIIVPAWGGDGYKERAPISIRLEMLFAVFGDDQRIIVTALSPQEVQRALTKAVPDQTIRGCPILEAFDESLEFIGLIGSDTALYLAIPVTDEKEEVNRLKRLQVFMRGVSISDKYAKTTIGSIMALPVERFIVGLRDGDDLQPLDSVVGGRRVFHVVKNAKTLGASSTLVKKRMHQEELVGDLLAPEVHAIIRKYHLYAGENR